MHAVATHGLSHRFATDTVLRQIDLEVAAGTIYGFLGPNGAGKTTTLRLILGLLRQQEGTIHVFGQPLRRHRIEILRRVGSSIESPSLYGQFWFNAGIYLAGIIPALVFRAVDLPASPIPFAHFLRRNLDFFVDVLPIVALQYLLALRFRSFMAPLGAGFALWILALGGLPWEYNYVLPYGYLAIDYTTTVQSRVSHALPARPQVFAAAWFVVFTVAAYVVYAARGDKG